MAKKHKNQNPSVPCAWIVSPTDKGRKSIKSGKFIYLKNEEEFEIELYNPLSISVLANIKINGTPVSKNGLIIRPAQRVYLECFVDTKRKFTFNTYEIEDSKEAMKATESNGVVEVFFYKEEVVKFENWKTYTPIVYYPYNVYYSNPNYTGISFSTGGSSGTINISNSTGTANYTTSNNCYFSSSVSGSDLKSFKSEKSSKLSSNYGNLRSKSVETGRIEGGEKSNQKFKNVSMNFESYHISSCVYQILPESRKPIDSKDVNKVKKETIIKHDLVALIEKIHYLYEKGILSEDEYNSKKEEILNKI